jgi:DNA-binding NarL/FixJ family response regulator
MRLLIVAGYASVRAGLAAILSEVAGGEIVGAVSGSAEWENVLPTALPDVVVWEVSEDDQSHVAEFLAGGETGMVALTDAPAEMLERIGDSLPAYGLLRREADGEEIVHAVEAVASGLVVLDRSFAALFAPGSPVPAYRPHFEDEGEGETLTAREREVLQLMALGLPNKIIAARLGISLHTVKYHVAAILAKLGASSRTEAVTLGARRGYVLL